MLERKLITVLLLLKVEKISGQQLSNRIKQNRLVLLDIQVDALVEFIKVKFGGICRTTDLPGIPEQVISHGVVEEKFQLVPKNGETVVILHPKLIEVF